MRGRRGLRRARCRMQGSADAHRDARPARARHVAHRAAHTELALVASLHPKGRHRTFRGTAAFSVDATAFLKTKAALGRGCTSTMTPEALLCGRPRCPGTRWTERTTSIARSPSLPPEGFAHRTLWDTAAFSFAHSPIGVVVDCRVFVPDVNKSYGPWLVPLEKPFGAMDTVEPRRQARSAGCCASSSEAERRRRARRRR